LPLLVDAAGGGLSKRTGSLSIADLRERGIEALAIDALLARLGTADSVEPVTSLDALVAAVDFARVGRAAARFSEDELRQLSARTLHMMPYTAVRERLGDNVDEALWFAVRGNLGRLADASVWAEVVRGPITPAMEDESFLKERHRHCQASRGTRAPGRHGHRPCRSRAAARAGRSSIRCVSRSPRARPGPRWRSSCR